MNREENEEDNSQDRKRTWLKMQYEKQVILTLVLELESKGRKRMIESLKRLLFRKTFYPKDCFLLLLLFLSFYKTVSSILSFCTGRRIQSHATCVHFNNLLSLFNTTCVSEKQEPHIDCSDLNTKDNHEALTQFTRGQKVVDRETRYILWETWTSHSSWTKRLCWKLLFYWHSFY